MHQVRNIFFRQPPPFHLFSMPGLPPRFQSFARRRYRFIMAE
jgi:hypothetical protein